MTTFTGARVETARSHDLNADRHEEEAVRSERRGDAASVDRAGAHVPDRGATSPVRSAGRLPATAGFRPL